MLILGLSLSASQIPTIVMRESPVEVSEAFHLTPVESVFSANPTIAEYEMCVAKALRLPYDLDIAICVSAFCLPSFQPEWAVFLVRLDKDCYEVHSSDFAEPMWATRPRVLFKLESVSVPLTADSEQELKPYFKTNLQLCNTTITIDTVQMVCRLHSLHPILAKVSLLALRGRQSLSQCQAKWLR